MSAASLKPKASGGRAVPVKVAPAGAAGHAVAGPDSVHDRILCELLPLQTAAELLANCLRVLHAIQDEASIRPEFCEALRRACPTWGDPFAMCGERSTEAVLFGLVSRAAEVGRQIAEQLAEGGAA